GRPTRTSREISTLSRLPRASTLPIITAPGGVMKATVMTVFLCLLAIQEGRAQRVEHPAAHPPVPRRLRTRGGTTVTASSDTAAWALADAQRIATRVRPQSLHAAAAEPVPAGVYSEHVDGRRHPELCLRFELFDRLLGAFSAAH